MSRERIDWSQLWYPGPARRFSAAEMASAGAEPPGATLKLVVLANAAFMGFMMLQFAPAPHTAVLTAVLTALVLLTGAAAQWLWWRPWRGPLFKVSVLLVLCLITLALAVRLRVPDLALRSWLAGILAGGSVLGCLLLWFLAVWRSHQIEARLAELSERERAADMARQLLAAQIQPHFIFNTLAALKHWVDTKDDRAPVLLEAFSGYLRATLPLFQRRRLPLADEADAVRRYLQVMQLRLGERLRHAVDIAPDVMQARLPPGLLLTLVENAIAHGVEPQLRGGTVAVQADAVGGALQIEVRDDGPGPAPAAREGTGLTNLRARLAWAYGDQASFELVAGTAGTCARLRLPLQGEADI
ncbi:MAG: sensor histidine kinase [Aquabacterium sp.]